MRKILKQIFVSGILISGVYCVAVSAKSLGKFTFDIDRAVYGNTGYSIEAKDTWTTSTANGIRYSDGKKVTKSYQIQLNKKGIGGCTKWSPKMSADGDSHKADFGKLSKGTYYINVSNADYQSGLVYFHIKGGGHIRQ